jgi:S-adenosylmethionine hydrolase
MSSLPTSTTRPVVAFMTDFGQRDGYVGVMKGVVLRIAPDAQLVDITHDIAPQNIASGAWILASSYRYFPKGTVFTCVVDPGVGSARQPIAVRAGDWSFVGPDNGLFSYIFAEQTVHMAVALTNPAYHLPQVNATFHGRDIFSPIAGHIAQGVPLRELGPEVDPATLQRIDLGQPVRRNGEIEGYVLHIDHFGNLVTNLPLDLVPELFSSRAVRLVFPEAGAVITERRRFFADVAAESDDERPFIFGDSSGHLAVAIRNGDAARQLNVRPGAVLTLTLL